MSSPRNPLARRWSIRIAAWSRWLHIYLSMFGLAATLFFSATGLTLNHPDWFQFGDSRSRQTTAPASPEWLQKVGLNESAPSGEGRQPTLDQLAIVEYLRATHGLRGAVADFRFDPPECTVSFKAPGYDADAVIDLTNRQITINESAQGLVALLNDLHKGRDSGPVWSWIIDLSAAILLLISATGLLLILYLKHRRVSGLVLAAIGAAAIVALVLFWVP
jgi:hypothetical protein